MSPPHTNSSQYELDGTTETYDPAQPSTTACPYLPGQTVNTMWMPLEQVERKRSASLSSMRNVDYKTMNPADKFVTPRPAPKIPEAPGVRLATSPMSLRHKRSARSLSPSPNWSWSPRKLFTRKTSSLSLHSSDADSSEEAPRSYTPSDDRASLASSSSSRTRDISPESLRKFLSDDLPLVSEPAQAAERPEIAIPDDIVEENEDDDNFATSAVSEVLPPTVLSPPPFKRNFSSSTILQLPSSQPETPAEETEELTYSEPPSRAPPAVPSYFTENLPIPRSHFSFSSESSYTSGTNPNSPDPNELPGFCHSEDEDDGGISSIDEEAFPYPPRGLGVSGHGFDQSIAAAFAGYSLPRASVDGAKPAMGSQSPAQGMGSPALIAHNEAGSPALLAHPLPGSGLDDLVNELGWMADVIRGKNGA